MGDIRGFGVPSNIHVVICGFSRDLEGLCEPCGQDYKEKEFFYSKQISQLDLLGHTKLHHF